MSWGADPDTLSMAIAEAVAERTGYPKGTLEYALAYRAAYDPVGFIEGNNYLAELDNEIEELKKSKVGDA